MNKYTILVVDDQEDVLELLQETFEDAGYNVLCAQSAEAALELLTTQTPDVILSDNRMANMSGVELFEIVRQKYPDPIRILMTGYADLQKAIEAINRGWVYKFIAKPFKMEEILIALRRALEYYEMVKQKRLLEQRIREQNAVLEQRVAERTRDLQKLTEELAEKNRRLLHQKNKIRKLFSQLQRSYLGTITALYFALEAKDQYTRGHSERVFHYSLQIGRKLDLSADEMRHLKYAAILHDLGKIGIPDSILMKPGTLTEGEYANIKDHPVVGASILDPIQFLTQAKEIIRHHHERFDGRGYPDGLSSDMIHIQGRIIAVADAYDAMRSDRPYRSALSREDALAELKNMAGHQFCPKCVEAFQSVLRDIGDFYDEPYLIEKYRDELKFVEGDMQGLFNLFSIWTPDFSVV